MSCCRESAGRRASASTHFWLLKETSDAGARTLKQCTRTTFTLSGRPERTAGLVPARTLHPYETQTLAARKVCAQLAPSEKWNSRKRAHRERQEGCRPKPITAPSPSPLALTCRKRWPGSSAKKSRQPSHTGSAFTFCSEPLSQHAQVAAQTRLGAVERSERR